METEKSGGNILLRTKENYAFLILFFIS